MTETPTADPTYAPKPTESPFRPRGVWIVLIALTLLAGVLRFAALDRPAIWGDESATAGRIVGSYQELLDQLAEGSFTPLHYEVMWWIGQGMPYAGDVTVDPQTKKRTFTPTHRIVEGGITMTPFYMRLVPAICGTLMIPAIYFLARQLFGPRVSLVAAGLACVSAYLLIYSRDAKMYSPLWLLCTLNVACLLWWLRVRSTTAWLCWVIAGVAMLGYHLVGAMVLAVNLIIVISAPRQHWSGWWKLAALIGYPFVLLFAWLYELLRRRFNLMVWWRFSEVVSYPKRVLRDFHVPTLLLFAIGVCVVVFPTRGYMTDFNRRADEVVGEDGEFNTDANGTGWVENYNRGRNLASLALYTTSAYLTGWEWPRSQAWEGFDDQSQVNPRTLKLLQASVIAMLSLMALGLVPWRRIFSPARARLERIAQDGRVDRRFITRRTLWIGAWLIVPAFGIYAQSVAQPAFVLDAVSHVAVQSPASIDWPRLPRPTGETTWDLVTFYFRPGNHGSFFSQFGTGLREFANQFSADDSLATSRLIGLGVVAAMIVAAIVWRRQTLTRTSLRLLVAVAVVVMLCGLLSLAPRFADKSVWMPRYVGVVMPAFLIACAVLVMRLPTWWLRSLAIAIFVIVNLGQYTARVFTPSEPPTDRIAADILASHAPEDTDVRTYINTPRNTGEPGRGVYPSAPAAYYLWLGTRPTPAPAVSIRNGSYPFGRIRVFDETNPDAIARNLDRAKRITRVIVWTSYDWDEVDTTDPIATALDGKFKRIGDEFIPAYDHWRWMKLYNLRRREYVRIAS